MANRTLYNDGVEVHQRHLEYDTDQRIASDREMAVDATTRGVLTGLVLSINGLDNTKVDITAGSGYAPNGDFMELAVGQTSQGIASLVANTENYVLLVYDETDSSPEAHEADGTTRNTKATVTPRIAVLTAAQYAALPTDDTVLSNNDKNRALLVGIATVNSLGTAIASVTNASVFQAALFTTQPVTITGIVIIDIDATTSTGTGTLTFNSGASTLTWAAPGDVAGAPVVISTSTSYTILSSGGQSLVVEATFSALPSSNKTDSITVSDVYGQTVPRFSAKDFQHRSMIGSGVASATNPHGMTLDDLAPGTQGTVEQHQDVMHANGIVRTSSVGFFDATVNTGPAPDTLTITDFSTGDLVYINGRKITGLVGSNTISFAAGDADPATYGIYLSQDGTLVKSMLAKFPAASTLNGRVQILDIVGLAAGAHVIDYTSGGNIILDGGIESPDVSGIGTDQLVRVYGLNQNGYMDLWVKGALPPVLTITETITVYAPPDDGENLSICTVPWSGLATGFLGYGFGAASAPNLTFDKRQYGNLAEINARKDAGMINAAQAVQELLGDGIFVRANPQAGSTSANGNVVTVETAAGNQLSAGAFAFPTKTIHGGVVYLEGRRLEVAGADLGLTDNAINRIYVDSDGVLQTTTSSWDTVYISNLGHPIVRLYEITVTATVETLVTDVREFVGQKRNVPMGVVGLNEFSSAVITSTDNFQAGLTVYGASSIALQGAIAGVGAPVGIAGTGYGVIGYGGNQVLLGSGTSTPTGVGVFGFGSGAGEGLYGLGGASGGTAVGGSASAGSNGSGGWFVAQGTGYGTRGDAVDGVALYGSSTGVTSVAITGINSGDGQALSLSGGDAGAGGDIAVLTATGAPSAGSRMFYFDGTVGGLSSGLHVVVDTPNGAGAAVHGEITGTSTVAPLQAGVTGLNASAGPGGYFNNTGTGNAINVGAGHAKFSGGTPSSTSATGYTNTLVPNGFVKAWANITTGADPTPPVVNEAFNIDGTSGNGFTYSGNNIVVVMNSAMSGTHKYAVVVTTQEASGTNIYRVNHDSATQFTISAYDDAGVAINFKTAVFKIGIVVFGSQ